MSTTTTAGPTKVTQSEFAANVNEWIRRATTGEAVEVVAEDGQFVVGLFVPGVADDLSPEEQARQHAGVLRGLADADAGRVISDEEFVARFRAKHGVDLDSGTRTGNA